jgi:hypothetical protein
MRPELWQPPVECSPAEQKVLARIRCAKLFVFLLQYRHEIFAVGADITYKPLRAKMGTADCHTVPARGTITCNDLHVHNQFNAVPIGPNSNLVRLVKAP